MLWRDRRSGTFCQGISLPRSTNTRDVSIWFITEYSSWRISICHLTSRNQEMKKLFALLLLLAPSIALAAGDSGFVSILSSNLQIISDGNPRAFIYVAVNNGGCS